MFLGNFFRNIFLPSEKLSDNPSNILQTNHVPTAPSEFILNYLSDRVIGTANPLNTSRTPNTEKTSPSLSVYDKDCDDKNCSKEGVEFEEKKKFSGENAIGLQNRERDLQKFYEDFGKLQQSIDEEYIKVKKKANGKFKK